MSKTKQFELPKAILSQLNEFSTSYFLVTVDEVGRFNVHQNAKTPEQQQAMINFIDVKSTALQHVMRQQAIMRMIEDRQNEEDGED